MGGYECSSVSKMACLLAARHVFKSVSTLTRSSMQCEDTARASESGGESQPKNGGLPWVGGMGQTARWYAHARSDGAYCLRCKTWLE